jgi:hypothetical protein
MTSPAQEQKKYKLITVRPDEWNVVTIPHDFEPVSEPDPKTGEWTGRVEDK